jgi:hypothetical protein
VGGQQLPSHSASATTGRALPNRITVFQHNTPPAASRRPLGPDMIRLRAG